MKIFKQEEELVKIIKYFSKNYLEIQQLQTTAKQKELSQKFGEKTQFFFLNLKCFLQLRYYQIFEILLFYKSDEIFGLFVKISIKYQKNRKLLKKIYLVLLKHLICILIIQQNNSYFRKMVLDKIQYLDDKQLNIYIFNELMVSQTNLFRQMIDQLISGNCDGPFKNIFEQLIQYLVFNYFKVMKSKNKINQFLIDQCELMRKQQRKLFKEQRFQNCLLFQK
ncbi:unnamed protein product [Paramecium sonneborni]|uniref:Uncharacterized protein n=1 Tax=Paramecium sonneborni TaxID=65129 RepID=A0A8S1MF97_9CILI|nr:unnamed protein product [Paramecium sonneborni]